MDASPQAGSSSVTVEYTDPSGLFPLVRPVIEGKLPLKNLHWKSPTRPVRSIESLRIGFTPAQHEADERKRSSDTAGTTTAPLPHRRHQIPGLRQTPYLKIYLLRCDDNETYKTSARKALRDWIKTQAATPQASGAGAPSTQEKHDAFEWLIVHVVQDGEGAERAAPASKWGRGSTTVLEKIRADFNGSSKAAVDRVAQLRLPRVGAEARPPVELREQVEDFVEKMKNAILASFDLRVAQYEEDIKEKDSQRSLPGWNFCTFFILKEGLARGFENVGLFEDALVGYDELAVGLDMTVREQLQGTGDQHGSAFLTFTRDWQEKAKQALAETGSVSEVEGAEEKSEKSEIVAEIDPREFPLDSDHKPYREMILGSHISVFDFRIYLFSRQLTLLLRAARAPSLVAAETHSEQKKGKKDKKPEDLLLLSELCERAAEFITMAARTLRFDLETGLADVDSPAKANVINNMVSSWAYAAALQILTQTYTSSLTLPESSLHAISKSAAAAAEPRPNVPRRSSSLVSGSVNNRPLETLSPDAPSGLPRSAHEQSRPTPVVTQKTGSEQLASGRGELLSLARRLLEEIASRCGWKEKWKDLGLLFDDQGDDAGEMTEVSLDAETEDKPQEEEPPSVPQTLAGIALPELKAALRTRANFRSHYEELTDLMYRHYIMANRMYSAQAALADTALLRYRQNDYSAAASYFHQIVPFYGNKNWILLEGIMLEMYARCLEELKRSDEYVRMMLRLLAKFAVYIHSDLTPRQKSLDASHIFTDQSPVSQYVEKLFAASSTLQKEVSVSFADFFADLSVKPTILHYADKDGFQMQLSLRFLLGTRIEVDSIKVRLVSASGSQSSEHWIETLNKTIIKSSPTKLLIDSSITLEGKYFVDRLEMRAGNLVFTFSGGNHSALPLGFREAADAEDVDERPYIYCFPAPEGLEAKITSPHLVNLEEMRTLEVELRSGWNDIQKGTIRVRPATAGLRLRVAEAEVVEGKISISTHSESGSIEIARLEPRSLLRLRIPYTVEEVHPMLSARAEVVYETDHGRFSYSSVHSIVSALPISVNVQDVFKDRVLFSRFTVSPAMMIPLRILKCSIPSSNVYQVQSNIVNESVTMDVFPKQPASLLYKIQQREDSVMSPGSRRSLRLSVEFTCVDDECLDAVESRFRTSIAASEFRQYASLLTSHIVQAFRTRLSTADMEVIGLIRELETLPYSSVGWDGLLSALKESADGLRAWLLEWHQNNPIISLPKQPTIPSRQIVIPVDIPEIQVLHTAELRLKNLADEPRHAAVGQMIAAELTLRHTRRWSSPEHREHASGALEFSYELHANPEMWLVGGRRRGNFAALENETKTFAVMLLPQKAGHLLLPGLEIRSFVPGNPAVGAAGTTGGGGAQAPASALQRRQIPCEVDYRNHGETVMVLPNLRQTTVSLNLAGGAGHGGAWLVDSERRREVDV